MVGEVRGGGELERKRRARLWKPGVPAQGQEVIELVHLRKVSWAASCVGGGGLGWKVGRPANKDTDEKAGTDFTVSERAKKGMAQPVERGEKPQSLGCEVTELGS